ncbi:hypothetical protein CoNPh32_CDS0016 [Staphylococcus phage S-CoN_Ph32]|nr:hypothetical protein CoNPh32_CDS0016 [Staphylococcus phage S-CoN_Ph32]
MKSKGNYDFSHNMKNGKVGRAYIPLTAAATWASILPRGFKSKL